jgi:hypothetical protein
MKEVEAPTLAGIRADLKELAIRSPSLTGDYAGSAIIRRM